jgi:hypothetical protein
MSTDFRALCAELLQPLAEYDGANPYHEHRDLITRARAKLAELEAVGPSLEDLGPLISWLTESATQSADAGRSKDAGMLTWAAQVVGERVDEDAPEHEPAGPSYRSVLALRDELDADGYGTVDLVAFALAVLARWGQPAQLEPVGPTDKEILGLAAEAFHYRLIPTNGAHVFVNAEEILSFARALHKLQANTTSTLPPSKQTTP